MKSLMLLAVTATLVISTIVGCAVGDTGNVPSVSANHFNQSTKKKLRAFRSEQELKSYFQKLTEEQHRKFSTKDNQFNLPDEVLKKIGLKEE